MAAKLTKAQVNAHRRRWAKRARSIHRKAVELNAVMVEVLGVEHEATDYSDGLTVHAEAMATVLESDGYDMWNAGRTALSQHQGGTDA